MRRRRNCLRNAPIRILLDAVVANPHVTDGNRHEQLATARLLLQGLKRALAQYRQLHLAHGSLHAEQQPVIGMARIVDAVLVEDECADKTTELQQRVPVAAIASKSRRLDRDHGTNASFAYGCQQLLEAGPRDAAAGAAKVVINDSDIAPAELSRPIGKSILAALALQVVGDLIGGRLTNVDDGLTAEVLMRDLAHAPPPSSRDRRMAPLSRKRQLPRSEGTRSDGQARVSTQRETPSAFGPPRTSLSAGRVVGA